MRKNFGFYGFAKLDLYEMAFNLIIFFVILPSQSNFSIQKYFA